MMNNLNDGASSFLAADKNIKGRSPSPDPIDGAKSFLEADKSIKNKNLDVPNLQNVSSRSDSKSWREMN